MNRCFAAFLALLCASITVSSACFAQPSALVHYDDLDLSGPAGVKALHRRIELAANRVCLDASGPFPTGVDFNCKVDALRDARAQVPAAIAEQRLSRTSSVAATEAR